MHEFLLLILFQDNSTTKLSMKKAEKVQFIIDELERIYPKTPVPLDHTDEYTLLISVLLSAQ